MRKLFLRIGFIAVLSGLISAPLYAANKVFIDIGKPNIKKSLIALPPFQYYGSKKVTKNIKTGESIYNTINNDLTVSDLFRFIPQNAFLEDTSKVGLRPAPGAPNGFKFQSWKTIEAEFLVRGGYRVVNGKISLEVYVYHVPQAKLVFGRTYEGPTKSARKIGHTFSNDLLKALTGKKGMFVSKLVASRIDSGKRDKEIFVMDWDGNNKQKITNHRSIAISPAWSPDGKKVAYTAFAYHPKSKRRNADLFVYDLEKNKRWLVSYVKGTNSGATFYPDGRHLLLTITKRGTPDIYKINLDGKILKRMTRGPNKAMNVEPAISPRDGTIAFSSDRGGKPMIYLMNAAGRGIRRITDAGIYNSSPVWSPNGDKIAFASYDKTHFDLFLMDANGRNLIRLTTARKKNGRMANNESPSFSPDGRHIAFVSDRTGKNQIYVINLDGTNERRITFDRHQYFHPKWSPSLD